MEIRSRYVIIAFKLCGKRHPHHQAYSIRGSHQIGSYFWIMPIPSVIIHNNIYLSNNENFKTKMNQTFVKTREVNMQGLYLISYKLNRHNVVYFPHGGRSSQMQYNGYPRKILNDRIDTSRLTLYKPKFAFIIAAEIFIKWQFTKKTYPSDDLLVYKSSKLVEIQWNNIFSWIFNI